MIEYKVIEQNYWPASTSSTEFEFKLNELSAAGFKISHVIPGFCSGGGTTFFPKVILEREMVEK